MKNKQAPFTTPKYINPMSDFGFKKIFKESGKKQLLIRPLNAIFGLEITDIEIGESEHLGQTPSGRKAYFDLYCTSSDGKRFIVEVQLIRQRHFLERALYYASFPITESARRGEEAGWDYDFPPVFVLGLLNFDFRELSGRGDREYAGEFIHRFSLRDDRTGERMTDRLQFAFLEIARFDKGRAECGNFEEQFLYMMKNLPTLAGDPATWEEDPYFQTMLEEAEYARMDGQEKKQYREMIRQDWDYKNTMDYIAEQGLAKGMERGLAQGMEKGRTEEKEAVARRMLSEGLSVELIAKCTELGEDAVRALAGN